MTESYGPGKLWAGEKDIGCRGWDEFLIDWDALEGRDDDKDDSLSSGDDRGNDSGGGRGSGRNGDNGHDEDFTALIRALVDDPDRQVEGDDVDRIVERVAEAAFDSRGLRVRPQLRGVTYQGRTIGSRENALFTHLAQRVVLDRQWRDGITKEEYVEDLRAAVRDPEARIGVGAPRGSQPLVYVLAENPVPDERRGARAEELMFVLYGTDTDAIITGYQASSMEAIDFSENVRWLR